MTGDAKGEYRGTGYHNDAELQAWLAKRASGRVSCSKGALWKFPIAASHRVTILFHEVHPTVILDRNDNHEIRFLDDAINPS